VVKTIAGTVMIDKIAKKLGVKLYETPVGFKYISRLMEKENILVGGEEAGGMGVKNYIPERDGTLAGLLLVEMMAYRKKNISQILRGLEKEFGKYYYTRDELKLGEVKFEQEKILNKLPAKILNKKVANIKSYDGIKIIFEDEDWLMLRGSGTEPIVRVYAEAKKQSVAQKLVEEGKKIILES
jgi:phosphomannomutase